MVNDSYIGLGTVDTTSRSKFEHSVEAENDEDAVEKLMEKYKDKDNYTLTAVYKNWKYNYKGAVSGDLVWHINKGFLNEN